MNKITGPVVLAGDFNAKRRSWNCHRANKNGNRLLDAALKSTFVVEAPTSPSYLNRSNKFRPDILDICLTRNVKQQLNFHVYKELDSDHYPVVVTSGYRIEKQTATFYNYKKADWEKFKADINNKLKDQYIQESELSIKLAAMKLKCTIINAANKYIPVSSVKNKTSNIPPDVLDLIKERNALLRLRQKHHHLVSRTVINNI
jgi:hypothetical protein